MDMRGSCAADAQDLFAQQYLEWMYVDRHDSEAYLRELLEVRLYGP